MQTIETKYKPEKASLSSVAMEVYRALLGERLAVLEADEFEGKTVKSVKQSLAAQFPGFAEYYFLILSVNPFFDSF